MRNSPLKVVDLFCGLGGMSAGIVVRGTAKPTTPAAVGGLAVSAAAGVVSTGVSVVMRNGVSDGVVVA